MCQWSIHESFHLFNAFRTTAVNTVCIKDIVYRIEDKMLLVFIIGFDKSNALVLKSFRVNCSNVTTMSHRIGIISGVAALLRISAMDQLRQVNFISLCGD